MSETAVCVACKFVLTKRCPLCMFAVVCRSSSGRSYLRPLGYQQLSWVADASRMVSRAVLLQSLVSMKDSTWVLEQPEDFDNFRWDEMMLLVDLQSVLKCAGV